MSQQNLNCIQDGNDFMQLENNLSDKQYQNQTSQTDQTAPPARRILRVRRVLPAPSVPSVQPTYLTPSIDPVHTVHQEIHWDHINVTDALTLQDLDTW